MKKKLKLMFFTFLFFRLTSIVFIQTSYVPDEYWQSLEVAHNVVFGYGYLTWEWKLGLRSYLYPFIFSILYKALDILALDYPFLIINLPRVIQALITTASDYYFFLMCKNFGFQNYWIKLSILTNWFWYYCGIRTITNTFETCLTTIALYYYPWKLLCSITRKNKSNFEWKLYQKSSLIYTILSVINCLVRPTAVTIWGPLIVLQLYFLYPKYLSNYLIKCLLPSLFFIFSSLLLDSIFYKKIIISPVNFLLFNVFENISSFYGIHPFYWYLTHGLPVVLGLHYLPFILSIMSFIFPRIRKNDCQFKQVYLVIVFLIILNVLIFSNIPHKEFRFLLPLTPLMMLMVNKFLTDFFTPSRNKWKLVWTIFLISGFLLPSTIFGIFHQRGTLSLMEYLRNEIINCKSNCSMLFLMPCHSTPLYSHLHSNISIRFITCEPPLSNYHIDESEIFFENPEKWLTDYWNHNSTPSHIILFDSLENEIFSLLNSNSYEKKLNIFHSLLAERNQGRYITVYERNRHYHN